MALKVTFLMSENNSGFSESWIDGAAAITPAIFAKANLYLQARTPVSGTGTQFNFVRVSVIGTPHLVQVQSTSDMKAPTQGNARDPSGNKLVSDFVCTSFLMRYVDSTGQRYKFQFMRGIPDFYVDNNGDYSPTAAFSNLMTAYIQSIVTNQWGWLGVNAAPPMSAITAIASQPSGQDLYTLAGAIFNPVDFNQHRVVRCKGITGCPNLNGQQVVIPQTAQTALTLRRIPIFPYTGAGIMTFPSRNQVVVAGGGVERIVERRAGRPGYVSVGRRRNIVRG